MTGFYLCFYTLHLPSFSYITARQRRRVWLFSVIMDLSFVLIKEQACCALSMPLITGKRGEVHYKYSKANIIQTQTCYSGSHLKRHCLFPASFGRKWCGLFISCGRSCAFTEANEFARITYVKLKSKKVTNTLLSVHVINIKESIE